MKTLQISNIIKNYGYTKVLTDVYMECTTGQIIGLLGRNGEGKTTLLEIIFGSKKSTEKSIKINNVNVKAASKSIAYISKDNFLPEGLRIKTIINIICPNKKHILFENLRIKPILNKYCWQIRNEEKKIVTILAFVNSESDFILIDEPFYGLAPITIQYIKEYLKNECKSKGIIISDHNYLSVLEICDQALLLKEGCLNKIKSEDDLKFYKYIQK